MRATAGPGKYFTPYGNPRLEDGLPGEHLPDRLSKEVIRFIETSVAQARPFLAYLSFYSVHTPLMARQDLREKYEERAKGLQSRFGVEGPRRVRETQDHAVYAGMVDAMDQAVGNVLGALDRLGLDGDTVVFFMSDNGGLSTSEGSPTSNLPLRAGKGWLYEGGIREPMIVRWPGVAQPGSVCHSPVISTDFYPTILEIAGLPPRPAQHLDGVSFAALLRGQSRERGPIFWHYPHYGNQGGAPGSAVRDGDWKLIQWHEGPTTELYDLSSDIGEKRNRVADVPERAQAMLARLERWRAETGAVMPAPNPAYDPAQPDGRGDGRGPRPARP